MAPRFEPPERPTVRRVALLSAVLLLVFGCSDDPESDPPSDPMNAMVELGRPVERGYDRTDWDPAAVDAALELARRVNTTTVGCTDEPGPVTFEQVKASYELVGLPMPGAIVACFSSYEDEDLSFSAFTDEEAKNTFIEAKAELICARALEPEKDPNEPARFDGIVYVDGGNVIIEPDSWPLRDRLATELGLPGTKMCPEAVGDRAETSTGAPR
jgi:hypothetical protein